MERLDYSQVQFFPGDSAYFCYIILTYGNVTSGCPGFSNWSESSVVPAWSNPSPSPFHRMVLAAVSWGPQDHPQIETVDRLTELRKATVLRVTIYYSASQQRERREGKRVCTSFWLSSLCRCFWCLWHDIFASLTLESLPLLELASPQPAFPAWPLPVPSHWWLLPTFPPHPQCLLTHPGAPTCGSSWHGLPPPPALQNTLLGDSHSTMLGGSDVWPYVWSITANQGGSPEPWVLTPYDTKDNPPQQRTIFCPKCQYCWGWGTWTRDYRCFSVFIFGGPQRLERSQFRNQGLNLGHSSESPKS